MPPTNRTQHIHDPQKGLVKKQSVKNCDKDNFKVPQSQSFSREKSFQNKCYY